MISSGGNNQDLDLQPASFQKRLLATALDIVICGFISLIVAGLLGQLLGNIALIMPLYVLFSAIFYLINSIFYQIRTGRTFGKYVLNLKVCYPNYKVDTRNEDIIKREFAKLFTYVTCGYSFFSKYKNEEIIAFHDEFSKTVVLNLSEEHEEYLYEYHYDTHYHSQDEEEEYLKAKQESEKILKQQREEEKKLKALEKEKKKQEKLAKKAQKKAQGKEDKPKDNQPNMDNQPNLNQQPNFMAVNQPVMESENVKQSDNTTNQHLQSNNVSENPSYVENQQINSDSMPQQDVNVQQNNQQPNIPVQNQQANPPNMDNIQQQPNMNMQNIPVQSQPDETGINIVGSYDFLDNNEKKQSKKGLGKLGNLFKSDGKKETKSNREKRPEEPVGGYYDHKMSDLVQDNTFMPTQNIFSEYYKGWSVKTDSKSKGSKLSVRK